MKINNEYSFKAALSKGINLFLGAGFSVLAKDKHGQRLPLGGELLKELTNIFKKSDRLSLAQVSSILENTKKDEFYDYLVERFAVKEFDLLYYNLNKINIRNIFTTNIDDLIPNIISKHPLVISMINC